MKLTKNDKARVVIQALYDMPELPSKDHPKVARMARSGKTHLDWSYEKAVEVLQRRVERGKR